MDFRLDTEQRMVQDSARQMFQREIKPVLDRNDARQPLPKEEVRRILQICASQGLTSARILESAGGSELSALNMGLMYEQLPAAIGLAVMSHEGTGARIYQSSSEEQRERLLPDIISARRIACTANTEPDVGSDPRSVKTRATDAGDHYVVTGRKMWITNATVCDLANVTCSTGKTADGLSEISRLIVERDESPFEARTIDMMGLDQGHLCEVVFDGVRVPKRNAVGQGGDAARVLTLSWLVNRPLLGLWAVNAAQAALDSAIQYASDRTQFGRKIGGFQLVQKLLADAAAAVLSSRMLCYYALSCIDNGERANQVSAMAKRYAISSCQKAVSLAMEVHGAMGLSRELGIEQYYRDLKMLTIGEGTNQILTLIEGRELTGIGAFRQ